MQRLPRYILLLREIIKCIPETEEGLASGQNGAGAAESSVRTSLRSSATEDPLRSPAGQQHPMDGDSEGEGAPRTARVARWSTATVVDGTPDGDGTRDCAPADGSEEENSEQLPRARTSTRALRRPGTRPGPTDEALALAEVRGTGALLRLALERIHKVTAGVDAKLGDAGRRQRAMKVLSDLLRRPDLIAPSRALLREGKLTRLRAPVATPLNLIVRASSQPLASTRDVFLFSDLLLFSSGEGAVKSVLSLSSLILITADSYRCPGINQGRPMPYTLPDGWAAHHQLGPANAQAAARLESSAIWPAIATLDMDPRSVQSDLPLLLVLATKKESAGFDQMLLKASSVEERRAWYDEIVQAAIDCMRSPAQAETAAEAVGEGGAAGAAEGGENPSLRASPSSYFGFSFSPSQRHSQMVDEPAEDVGTRSKYDVLHKICITLHSRTNKSSGGNAALAAALAAVSRIPDSDPPSLAVASPSNGVDLSATMPMRRTSGAPSDHHPASLPPAPPPQAPAQAEYDATIASVVAAQRSNLEWAIWKSSTSPLRASEELQIEEDAKTFANVTGTSRAVALAHVYSGRYSGKSVVEVINMYFEGGGGGDSGGDSGSGSGGGGGGGGDGSGGASVPSVSRFAIPTPSLPTGADSSRLSSSQTEGSTSPRTPCMQAHNYGSSSVAISTDVYLDDPYPPPGQPPPPRLGALVVARHLPDLDDPRHNIDDLVASFLRLAVSVGLTVDEAKARSLVRRYQERGLTKVETMLTTFFEEEDGGG